MIISTATAVAVNRNQSQRHPGSVAEPQHDRGADECTFEDIEPLNSRIIVDPDNSLQRLSSVSYAATGRLVDEPARDRPPESTDGHSHGQQVQQSPGREAVTDSGAFASRSTTRSGLGSTPAALVEALLQQTKDKYGASGRVQGRLAEDFLQQDADPAKDTASADDPSSPGGRGGSNGRSQGGEALTATGSKKGLKGDDEDDVCRMVADVFKYELFEANEKWAKFLDSGIQHKKETWEEGRRTATTPWQRWRWSESRMVSYMTLSYPDYSNVAFAVSTFILVTILLNTVTFCIESVPHYEHSSVYSALTVVDYVCVGIFTLEYVARLVCCPSVRGFIFSVSNFLDLLSIAPFYIELMVTQSSTEAFQTRIVRLVRLLRVLRMFRAWPRFRHLTVVVDTIKDSADVLTMLIFLLVVLLVLFGTIFFFVEPGTFDSIPQAMWYSQVTLTTTGYGDVYPVTPWGRFVAGASMLACMVIVSLPIAVIGGNFSNRWSELKAFQATVERSKRVWTKFTALKEGIASYNNALDDISENLLEAELVVERELAIVREELAVVRVALRRGRGPGDADGSAAPGRSGLSLAKGLVSSALNAVRTIASAAGSSRPGSVTARGVSASAASRASLARAPASTSRAALGTGDSEIADSSEHAMAYSTGLGLGTQGSSSFTTAGPESSHPPQFANSGAPAPHRRAELPAGDDDRCGAGASLDSASLMPVAGPSQGAEGSHQADRALQAVRSSSFLRKSLRPASGAARIEGEAGARPPVVELTPQAALPNTRSRHWEESGAPRSRLAQAAETAVVQLSQPAAVPVHRLEGVSSAETTSQPAAGGTLMRFANSAAVCPPSAAPSRKKTPAHMVRSLLAAPIPVLGSAAAAVAAAANAAANTLLPTAQEAPQLVEPFALQQANEAFERAMEAWGKAKDAQATLSTLVVLAHLLRSDGLPEKLEKMDEQHRVLRCWQGELKGMADAMWALRDGLDSLAWTLEEDKPPAERIYTPATPEERAEQDAAAMPGSQALSRRHTSGLIPTGDKATKPDGMGAVNTGDGDPSGSRGDGPAIDVRAVAAKVWGPSVTVALALGDEAGQQPRVQPQESPSRPQNPSRFSLTPGLRRLSGESGPVLPR